MYCLSPFNNLYVGVNNFSTCCGCWLDRSAKIARSPDLINAWDIWNHENFQKLRQAVIDKNWRHCHNCNMLRIKNLSQGNIPSEYKPIMDKPPKSIIMADDLSCNLSCWSCRKSPVISHSDINLVKARESIWEEWLSEVHLLSMLGSGDPIHSEYYRNFLLNLDGNIYPNLKITIWTNGILLWKYWNDLHKIYNNIEKVVISLDAGSRDVYKKVRGGNWSSIIKTLNALSNVKVWLTMTVSECNFLDMPNFCEFGNKYGVDKMILKPIEGWWQSKQEIDKINVWKKFHPRHQEFKSILHHQSLQIPNVDYRQLL